MEFKNKNELLQFVKKQINIDLKNDENDFLNKKRNVLHTQICRSNKNPVLMLFEKYNIRVESHISDMYFIFVK